jgi:hypothetical protein
MNSLSSIFQASHKGALIIGFDSATIPKLVGGKKNPMQGRVTKVMTGAVAMVNRNYENARNKQLQVAGFKPTFEVKPRKWGVYAIKGMPVLTHKGAVYLNTSILKAGAVSYLLDGKAIDKAEIDGLPVSRGVGIDKASVATQLADMTDAQRASIAVFKGLLDEATANPDSMTVDNALMADIVDNTKDLFPRDFKAESITALRCNRTEYTNIDSEVV